MVSKKVRIVVVSWNSKKFLEECLESVKKNTFYKNYSLTVVDNASTDGSTEMVEKKFPWVQLIKNKSNKGFGAANNQVFEKFEADYFFMLAPDARVTKNWLSKVVSIAESNERIGIVGCKEIYPKQFSEKNFSLGEPIETLTTLGAMTLIKKNVLKNAGLLDGKNFSPAYGEETDLCFRARDCGFLVFQAENIPIIHHGSVISTKQLGFKKRFLLTETHRLRAILFNLSFFDALKLVPGLGLIFLRSIPDLSVYLVLKAYFSNLADFSNILRERKKRKQIAKKIIAKIWDNN